MKLIELPVNFFFSSLKGFELI